jgi:hypothetical protein
VKNDLRRVNRNKPCILIWGDGWWDEEDCNNPYKIICEIDGNTLSPTGTYAVKFGNNEIDGTVNICQLQH